MGILGFGIVYLGPSDNYVKIKDHLILGHFLSPTFLTFRSFTMAPKMLRSSGTGEVSSEMAETWKDVEAISSKYSFIFQYIFPVYLDW